MTILDTTGAYVGPDGIMIPDGVYAFTLAQQIEHRIYARAAALQAATRVVVANGRFNGRAPLEVAEAFEEWLLRPVGAEGPPDGPVAREPVPGVDNTR